MISDLSNVSKSMLNDNYVLCEMLIINSIASYTLNIYIYFAKMLLIPHTMFCLLFFPFHLIALYKWIYF